MRLENSGGDVLARGGHRAQFQGPNVSQEKWNAIWSDSSDADVKETGDASPVSGADKADTGK